MIYNNTEDLPMRAYALFASSFADAERTEKRFAEIVRAIFAARILWTL